MIYRTAISSEMLVCLWNYVTHRRPGQVSERNADLRVELHHTRSQTPKPWQMKLRALALWCKTLTEYRSNVVREKPFVGRTLVFTRTGIIILLYHANRERETASMNCKAESFFFNSQTRLGRSSHPSVHKRGIRRRKERKKVSSSLC